MMVTSPRLRIRVETHFARLKRQETCLRVGGSAGDERSPTAYPIICSTMDVAKVSLVA